MKTLFMTKNSTIEVKPVNVAKCDDDFFWVTDGGLDMDGDGDGLERRKKQGKSRQYHDTENKAKLFLKERISGAIQNLYDNIDINAKANGKMKVQIAKLKEQRAKIVSVD